MSRQCWEGHGLPSFQVGFELDIPPQHLPDLQQWLPSGVLGAEDTPISAPPQRAILGSTNGFSALGLEYTMFLDLLLHVSTWPKLPSLSLQGLGHPAPSFRPYLLALLTHQSSWATLHQCIRVLLGRSREQR